MIICQFFDGLNGCYSRFFILFFRFVEHDKMANDVEQSLLVQHPLDKGFQLTDEVRFLGLAVNGLPGHKMAEVRGDGACLCLQTVRYKYKTVVGE